MVSKLMYISICLGEGRLCRWFRFPMYEYDQTEDYKQAMYLTREFETSGKT